MPPSDEPHVIRLRGPWQLGRETVHRAAYFETALEICGDVRLPIRTRDYVVAEFRGRLELRRNFNWPEPLGYRESLWIVVQEAAWSRLSISLNGQPLGAIAEAIDLPAAWDITSRVAPHNELLLAWNIDAPAEFENQSWVEVQLEVRQDVGPPD